MGQKPLWKILAAEFTAARMPFSIMSENLLHLEGLTEVT